DEAGLLWDSGTAQEPTPPRGSHGGVGSVCFSPDGKTLVTGSEDNTVRLWDVVTWQERAVLRGHAGKVTSLWFSPDGNTLATGSEDGTVRLWKAATAEK